MKRRAFLSGVAALSPILAGCAATVGEEETPRRTDNGVAVANLTEYASGDRSCYHEYDAEVVNENEQNLSNVEVTVSVYKENGQRLDKFTVVYDTIDVNETKSLNVEHGPEQGQCYSTHPDDYEIEVNYE